MKTNLFYTIQPFYLTIIILISLCIIYIIYIYALFPIIRKKKIINDIIKANDNIKIIKTKPNATYTLNIDNVIYNISIVFISEDIDLQINNIDTWYAYKKDNSKKIKINKDFIHDKSLENKIIILARHAKTIKKVINECEMIMVNDNIDVYGMHILSYNQYDYLFSKEIIK